MSQAEFKQRLKVLMAKSENQVCADCPERQPRWASLIKMPGAPPGSIPCGAFVCLECSGSHRRLGTHIAFVRSINLDSWKEKEVLAMESAGNKRINEIFEGRLKNFGTHTTKPSQHADGRTRERFIRDKYELRKYYDPVALQRMISNAESEEESSEEESEEEEVVVVKKKSSSAKMQPIRAPSDAARQRAESRKERLNAYRAKEAGNSRSSTIPIPIPVKTHRAAPVPPPAQEVDLLGFSSTPPTEQPHVTQQTTSSATTDPAAASIDLFAQINITSSATSSQVNTNTTITSTQTQQQPQSQPQQQQADKKKFNNDEILSMFNAPTPNSYYSNTPANAISNSFASNGMNSYANMQQQQPMQPYATHGGSGGGGYPVMMQQQTTTVQSNNPNNQFQYQHNNSFMTNNNANGYMGGNAATTATSTTSMFIRQSANGMHTQPHSSGKLDSNGFPLF